MLGRRGRTQPGRLARLDDWLAGSGHVGGGGLIVDLGIGDAADTTIELARRFGEARVVGVDHDPARVEAARARADLPGNVEVREGGFALPVEPGSARLIRVMNVLREYRPEACPGIHRELVGALAPGGLLVEGSSDADGAVVVAHLIRPGADGPVYEGLLLSTGFQRGFAPWMFRDWLPRDLRACRPGEPVHDPLSRWTAAWQDVRARGVREPAAAFVASAREVADLDAGQAGRGHVVWRRAPSG